MSRRPTRPKQKRSQSGKKKSPARGEKPARRKRRWSRKRSDAPPPSDSEETNGKPKKIRLRPDRRKLTPFHLMIFGIVTIIVVTVAVKMQSNREDRAEWDLKTAVDRGEAALKEGNFLTSAEEFGKACAALDVLKRNDPQAEAIRQRFRETTAAGHLLTDSIVDFLSELKPPATSASNQEGASFDLSYGRRWLVMETTVEKMTTADGRSRTVIDCPLISAGVPVQFDADLPLFEKLSLDGEPQRVIFAAELQDYLYRDREPRVWTIRFHSETAFLWSDYETYRAIGFAAGDAVREKEIRDLLAQQTLAMGIQK